MLLPNGLGRLHIVAKIPSVVRWPPATISSGRKDSWRNFKKNGKTGFLVKKFDQTDLAEKIDLLLNDYDLRSKMGENGQERIHKMFSIDQMVRKYVSFYRELEQKTEKKRKIKLDFKNIQSLKNG